MDPASQYYAALYQQQMSAYQQVREHELVKIKLNIYLQQAAVAAALGPYGQAALGRGGGYPGGAAAAEMAVSVYFASSSFQ